MRGCAWGGRVEGGRRTSKAFSNCSHGHGSQLGYAVSAAASLYAPGMPWYATLSFFLCPVSTSSPSQAPDVAFASPVAAADTILATDGNLSDAASDKVCAGLGLVAPPAPNETTAILWRDTVDRARSEGRGIARMVAVKACLIPNLVNRVKYGT